MTTPHDTLVDRRCGASRAFFRSCGRPASPGPPARLDVSPPPYCPYCQCGLVLFGLGPISSHGISNGRTSGGRRLLHRKIGRRFLGGQARQRFLP